MGASSKTKRQQEFTQPRLIKGVLRRCVAEPSRSQFIERMLRATGN